MAALKPVPVVAEEKCRSPIKLYHYKRKFHTGFKRRGRLRTLCRILLLVCFSLFFLHFYLAFVRYQGSAFIQPPRVSLIDRSTGISLDPSVQLYSRHTSPWRKYPDLLEKNYNPGLTPKQSRNRFLVSTAGEDAGDGLGHRFLVQNYERILSDALHLTYVHRKSHYGSLTGFRRNAVDDFFGWSKEPNRIYRRNFLGRVCARRKKIKLTDACKENLVVCKKLRRRNGLVKRIVTIPLEVAFCPRIRFGAKKCKDVLQRFIKQHPHPYTLFHTPNICSWKLYWSDQRITRGWHFNRYWRAKRRSKFDPRYVNIAVHIRRGDFLQLSNRVSIADNVYAKIIRQIISVISEIENNANNSYGTDHSGVNFKIHIYSQGLFQPHISNPLLRFLVMRQGFFGNHNVNHYGTKYVSEKGIETEDGYWDQLLGNHSRISCDLHISEDTLDSLEQMIAADVLIGSASALSIHIASQLSRGIPFLPVKHPPSTISNMTIRWYHEKRDLENRKHDEYTDENNVYFDREQFRRVWMIYRKHIGADKALFSVLNGENRS